MSTKLSKDQRGVSIVELLVTLPIAAIIVVYLIVILFNQYGSVLAESSKANLRSGGQALLTNLQDELLFTIEYGQNLDASLSDSYGPTGGWTYDTDPQTLIIYEVSLDSDRRDIERSIVRRDINPCETSPVTSNPVAVSNIIYFVEDTADSRYKRLVKRTITPEYDTCGLDDVTGDPCTVGDTNTCPGVAKRKTCPEVNIGSNGCESADSILSENVLDFNITYFAPNNVETAFPSAADKIKVELTLGDNVYGRDIEVTITHSIRKIN